MTPAESSRTQTIDPVAVRTAHEGRMQVFARTDRGARDQNQDAFLVANLTSGETGLHPQMASHPIGERGSLLAVSDGTGEAGELASEMAVAAFHRLLAVTPSDLPIAEQLHRAAQCTAKYLYSYFRRRPEMRTVGATLTAALVRGNTAYIAHIGDSRAYLVRGNRIRQITRDQTLAQALIDSGAIEPDRTDARPPEMMLQSLGPDPTVHAVLTAIDLLPGDMLLLCTDGLSNALGADELLRAVYDAPLCGDACRLLVERAIASGGTDNTTVVLAYVDAIAHDVADDAAVTWTLPAITSTSTH